MIRNRLLVLLLACFAVVLSPSTSHAAASDPMKALQNLELPVSRTAQAGTENAGTSTPANAAGGGQYTVVPGDCLWNIAAKYLGNGSRYMELVEANKSKYPSLVKNPNLIYPGWVLTIPGQSGNLNPGNSTASRPPSSSPGSSPGNSSPSNSPAANPNVPAPAAGASGGRALYSWLQRAGLSGEKLKVAWAVGMAESGGNPRAHNGNAGTGDNSYGLYQINMINSLGPARRRQYNLSSNEELFNPETNIRVMLHMSNNCTNWQPWSAYKNGSYRRFLSQFPP
ncbi:MAG TPA: LysM peptidoglycan-binding domain-containing protein [Candidatus Ozemobacteraceae bacterium]|nr:LysM peptidoglycan-binding domain-containing protein [Candidatus Ozemobacteraceae bacterium]